MRSLAYIEEDYLAGLLKDYFAGNGKTTYVVTDPAAKRHLKSHGQDVSLPGRNNLSLKNILSGEKIDLLLIQSDNFERTNAALELAETYGRRVPTLVITDERDRVAERSGYVHCITMQELLEGNLRWHIVLAQTARRVEEVRAQFEHAKAVLILLQDDPDPDAIASGLALRHVLGRHKQTATIGSFGRATRPENIAMARLLEIEVAQLHPEDVPEYDRIAMVDLQPPHIRTLLPRIDLVVDHHPEQFGYEAKIRDIRPGYGATATILLEYLLSTGHSVGQRLATAMLYGIKSDTFLLARETNEWDVEAFSYLYPLANHNLLRRIERPELPPSAIDCAGPCAQDAPCGRQGGIRASGPRRTRGPDSADSGLQSPVRRHRMGRGQRYFRFRPGHFGAKRGLRPRGRQGTEGGIRRHGIGRGTRFHGESHRSNDAALRGVAYRPAQHPRDQREARTAVSGKSPKSFEIVRAVVQRVTEAAVRIGGKEHSRIGAGLMVLVGVEDGDSNEDAETLAHRVVHLRVMEDESGRMNRSLLETGGALLAVSQFTLLGDCRKGRRPSFVRAAAPEEGSRLYDRFVDSVRSHDVQVETGVFQTMMDVELTNSGPVTLILDTRKNF